jgi:hypothetical protein
MREWPGRKKATVIYAKAVRNRAMHILMRRERYDEKDE